MTIINMENRVDEISVSESISKEWRGVLAEFLATLLLVYFGCMGNIRINELEPNPAVYGPLAFGLTVMFNIQIFGHISGAYMNPFVAIIAVIFGKITPVVGLVYVLVEFAGAILGYGLLITMSPIDIAGEGACMTLPRQGVDDFQALGIEIILTAALSLINCAIWDPVNAHNSDSSPIKFGLTIVGLSIIGGPMTGASMNPARSLGPAVWTNNWDSHWVYWVGPLVGGILPAIVYKYIWLRKPEPKNQ